MSQKFVDYDFWGSGFFTSPTKSVNSIQYAEVKNAVYEEMSIRENVNVDKENKKDDWGIDSRLKWVANSLEGGNARNQGLKISKFAIKRRNIDELNSVTLGYEEFKNDSTIEYTDYSQPNDSNLVYSIVPISDQLEGIPNEVTISSEFVGWWIVDRETNEVLGFDKFMESAGNIETSYNQKRTQIDTFGRFPRFIRTSDQSYHTFSLSATFIPEENERSGRMYTDILEKFINTDKPFLIKSDTGLMYVCNLTNIRNSTPQNTWKGHDYMTVTIDCVEVADYLSYMNGEV